MKILDLGCNAKKYRSPNPSDVVIGLDIQKLPSVDVVWDLNKLPLPFPNASFDMVHMRHTLEHVNDPMALVFDVYRILKTGGEFKIIVPHYSNPIAHHIEHTRRFSAKTFDCMECVDSLLFKTKFEVVEKRIKLITPWRWCESLINRISNFYEWRLTAIIPASEVHFTLKKVK